MTKKVRIENANTADWQVLVREQHQQSDGTWSAEALIQTLGYPGQAAEFDIWQGKRLIVEEGPLTDYHWTQKVKHAS